MPLVPALLALVVALSPVPDTSASAPLAPMPDTVAASASPMVDASDVRADTVLRRRPRAIEVSDAYALRLRIHRYASYAVVPLFVAQSVAGNQLYQSGGNQPDWAWNLHRAGAGGLGALFTVNTVTGVWNLWDSRGVSEGRTRRLLHSGLMLASDAGFAYAGIKLGPDATRSTERRLEHRRVAYISMTGALLGYATMLFGGH